MIQETVVMLQEHPSSGDNLSELIPFPTINPVKECEYEQCYYISRFKRQIKQSFYLGFIIPMMWLINLSVYVYFQFFIDKEVTHSKIDESELPTLYNNQECEKGDIQLKDIVQEIDELTTKGNSNSRAGIKKFTNIDGDISSSETLFSVESSKELEHYRQQYLLDVANNIISSHDSLRKHHSIWALRSLFGVLFYVIVALFIYLLVSHSVSRVHTSATVII